LRSWKVIEKAKFITPFGLWTLDLLALDFGFPTSNFAEQIIKNMLKLLFILSNILSLGLAAPTVQTAKPNVLLVVVDDFGKTIQLW